MTIRFYLAVAALAAPASAYAAPDDLAKAFGAREQVISASISPDGAKISLVAAGGGRATRVHVLDAREGTEPRAIATASGKPEYLRQCEWVSSDRLACTISGEARYGDEVYGFSSVFAVDAAGGDVRPLSQRRGQNALGYDLRGGEIVDLLPGENGHVLMSRSYVPEGKVGSLIEKRARGLGVDRIDTRTGAVKIVERANDNAFGYLSDGLGNVRIMGLWDVKGSGFSSGKYDYVFRSRGSSDWRALSTYDTRTDAGFVPIAIDAEKDLVYGLEKIDGRDALVSIGLDQVQERKVVFSHPVVDVGGVVTIGRDRKPVGASYTLDKGEVFYFDPDVKTLADSLGKALGGKAVSVGDMSADRKRALIWAGSDLDPGQYYLFDRERKSLSPVMPDRPELVGRTLAHMRSITYRAADGTSIPAYLTLPPGKEDAKGLPAVVMPHGGPQSRDRWGFDWLVQYFAARGFAVIQPQFRGSAGYGEQWLMENGYKSWRTAVGDVVDAGRWLVAEGIAAPDRLTVLGWSYGGYAALQAQAVDPSLFKAIVAIAPVTDIGDRLRQNRWNWAYQVQKDYMGSGQRAAEASPTSYVAAFRAPVLMFHGTDDGNVDIRQSRIMESKLRAADKPVSLVVYDGLTHNLDDSDARADMLQRASDFLLRAGRP